MTGLAWFLIVGFTLVAWSVGFGMGRTRSTFRHEHAFGHWELQPRVLTEVALPSPTTGSIFDIFATADHRVETRDVQQRECLGCGWIERKAL